MVSFALSPERPLNKGLGMLQMSSAKVVLYFGQGERGMFVIFFDGTRYEIVPHARSTFEERDGWMIIDGAHTVEEAQSKITKDRDFFRSQLSFC